MLEGEPSRSGPGVLAAPNLLDLHKHATERHENRTEDRTSGRPDRLVKKTHPEKVRD